MQYGLQHQANNHTYKRVSELRSVPYVTMRPILRLRISAPDPENKLDEIPPPNSIASQEKAGRRIF
jgi:hypothetical protein